MSNLIERYYVVESKSDIMLSRWERCCTKTFYSIEDALSHIDNDLPNANTRIIKIEETFVLDG